ERKWSGLAIEDGASHGVYVLGALEVLRPYVRENVELETQADAWATGGLRVLLVAAAAPGSSLHDSDGQPCLPLELRRLGLMVCTDELRPEARETLQRFAESGIRVKIISGDNPQTVAALAQQAGLGPDARLIAGPELAAMDGAQFEQVAEDATIFGRTT